MKLYVIRIVRTGEIRTIQNLLNLPREKFEFL